MATDPGRRSGFLGSLSGRTILLCVVIALVAAIVTVAVSVPLIAGAARAQASATLGRLADVTVSALERADMAAGSTGLDQVLTSQEVSAFLIGPGERTAPGLSAPEQRDVLAGREIDAEVVVDGADYLVAARPVAGDFGVVLLEPVESVVEPAGQAFRRLLAAVGVGVVVASVLAWVASRRVTRPLRQFADTARALSAGERGVQVAVTGPREITAIARSLNDLSGALEVSEDRQRQFLLSVSHELRTPLTAVRGYAEALADGMVPADEVARTGTVMQAEAERLDRLVADLLDLARLDAVDVAIELVPVDVGDIVAQAAEVWRSRCDRVGVELLTELPPVPLVARADPVRTRQIIDNLAENALRVTPAGRPIVIGAHGAPDWVGVSVRDGGPGLTADDLAVAFEPAALYGRYRGVRAVGTGVGLALVGRLAARMGGVAQAGTAPEGGASFTVWLPRT